jgi:hypothetical protein
VPAPVPGQIPKKTLATKRGQPDPESRTQAVDTSLTSSPDDTLATLTVRPLIRRALRPKATADPKERAGYARARSPRSGVPQDRAKAQLSRDG